MEHLWLQTIWGNIGGLNELNVNCQAYQESLLSSWIQRTFADLWEQGHNNLFLEKDDFKAVKRKVAEQFMFELYELKEYVDSGMAVLNFMSDVSRTDLNTYVMASDDALYNLFKTLKLKYPQTAIQSSVKIPEIVSTKTNLNLFDLFPSKCFSDPENMNYQTTYEDIKFLLQKAIELETDFKSDMMALLGERVLTCPKVEQVTKNGKTSFNACAVRRIFVKWT